MKKFYPYVLPSLALIIVLFLAYRWYVVRTQRDGMIGTTEGVQIEDLNTQELDRVMKGVGDFKSTELSGEEGTGSVRYEISDTKVLFSVTANLVEDDYSVWVLGPGDTKPTKAFDLEYLKGGYTGSASLPVSELPLEVMVARGMGSEQVVLSGTVEAE